MARLQGGRPHLRERFVPQAVEARDLVESQINKGMITMQDSADIEPGAGRLVKNMTVRFDRTARRPGSILLLPVKPDALPILKLAFIKKKDGTGYTIRMTPTSIYTRGVGVWNVIAGVLTGTNKDRFRTAVVLNDFVFTNNGADEIQRINFGAATFADLGNAPKYRYITGIADRLIGAALRGVDETEIGWSAMGIIDEWNSVVNETAGKSPLIYTPDDLSDFITGIFTSTHLVVLREKSVWIGYQQPIPTNPFHFRPEIPYLGCDAPHSAQLISGGLAWLDRRTKSVYAWALQGVPEPIGRPIEKDILENVNDPAEIFSAYNPIHNEYSICIPQVGSNLVNVWTYNLRSKAWARNEYYALTSMDDTDLATAGITIDQLGDVPIDMLTGTIDNLSPTEAIISTRAIGRNDGTIATEDINTDVDAPHTDFPTGHAYETIYQSKAFDLPGNDVYFSEFLLEYESQRGGSFTVEYSLDGGATTASWKLARVVVVTTLGKPQTLKFKKNLRTRRFAWRIHTTSGLFDMLKYKVRITPSEEQK